MNAISECLRAAARQLPVVIVACAMIGNAMALTEKAPPKTSFSTDFSDIWWDPLESGWGMQMVETGSFIFATIYVYDADRKPTWFTGELDFSTGSTFTGPLYVNTGPYFGGPFEPTTVTNRVAGTMTFQATAPDTGLLNYSVDGVVVNKTVQRQPLTLDDYNGTFAAVATQTTTNCTNAANNGTTTIAQVIQITQNAQVMAVVVQNPGGGSCTLNGAYSQLGRNGRLNGTYTCTSGDAGMIAYIEMNNHVRQFNARTVSQSNNTGCLSTGRVTGLIPN